MQGGGKWQQVTRPPRGGPDTPLAQAQPKHRLQLPEDTLGQQQTCGSWLAAPPLCHMPMPKQPRAEATTVVCVKPCLALPRCQDVLGLAWVQDSPAVVTPAP